MRNFLTLTQMHMRLPWLSLLMATVLFSGAGAEILCAQAPAPAPAAETPAAAPDASAETRQQEFQRRFNEGLQLYNESKFSEARAIFDGILAEEPKKAMGSLFFGGLSSLRLGESQKAVEYLERFRAIDSKDPRPVVYLIQAYQSLKKTLKVEGLRRELYAMRKKALAENPDRDKRDQSRPELAMLEAPTFVRERIRMQGGVTMEISEAFNYKDSPHGVFIAQIIGADGQVSRNIYISYEPDMTAQMRKDHPGEAKYKEAEVFVYSELFTKNEQTDRIEIYRIEFEQPTYEGSRRWILEMLARPPKPQMTIGGEALRAAAEKNLPGAAPGTAPAPGSNPAPASGGTSPIALPPSGAPAGTAPLPSSTTTPQAPAPPGTKRPAPRKPAQP